MSDGRRGSEDQFQTLLDTVERIRREKYPGLDADLVQTILRQHTASTGTDPEIPRLVEQAVEKFLFPGE
jgi:hypothetical protein